MKAMDNDFDTPKALSVIFDFIRKVNKKGGGKKSYEFMLNIDEIFNILTIEDLKIPKEIVRLMEEREKSRSNEDWKKADETRNKIIELGYVIEDSEKGPIIKKKL